MVGILSAGRLLGSSAGFSPLSLFAASEPGVWFDPSDLTTVFQDSAGTTPVTATGQTVGLILDKSRGLALGSNLVTNGTFDTNTTGWTARNANSELTVVSGELQVKTLANEFAYASQSLSTVAGRSYILTANTNVVSGQGSIAIGVSQGTSSIYSSGGFTGSALRQIVFVATGATTVINFYQLTATADLVARYDNISCRELSGRHAFQATSGSRPTYQVDANGKAYLNFDGSDDGLATAAIDFSAVNKLTLCAGLRKASDSAQGVVAELTSTIASNNGGFLLSAPNSAAANYNFSSKGTTQVDNTITTYTAPITNVVTGLADISAPSNIIRVNGSQVGSAVTSSQGTGNYANAVLNIGRRGGSTLPFSGRLYSLIIRGAATSDGDVTKMETWVNGKTGAY